MYVEWAQPDQYYHGVDMYNLYIKTRLDTDWEIREVVVPPVAKHNVEKVRAVQNKPFKTDGLAKKPFLGPSSIL